MWNIWDNALHIVIDKIHVIYFELKGRGEFGNCVPLSDFRKENKVLY